MVELAYDREQVFKAAQKGIASAYRDLNGHSAGGGAWTKQVKKLLCSAAKEFDFYVCAAGVETQSRHWGEWLYDLCWLDYEYDEAREPKYLKSVALIVESEWLGKGDVEDDFEKLLAGNAAVKCLIWDSNRSGCSAEEMVLRLRWLLEKFHPVAEDDLYLLSAYMNEGFRFWRMTKAEWEPIETFSP